MTPIPALPASPDPAPRSAAVAEDAALREKAQAFEAMFLAEMLSHAGLDAARGVPGAEAFSSFTTRALAERMADAGGIGLADALYRGMLARQGGGA